MVQATDATRRTSFATRIPLDGPALTPSAWLRFDLIRRFLMSQPAESFLEIGCGMGALGARLAQVYDYVGYEPDRDCFAVAEKRIPGRIVNDLLPSVPTRPFDLAGAFEVLEHIEHDVATLRTWKKWLNPGGWLLLSVPAHPARFGPTDRFAGHFRRYSREALTNALINAGYTEPRIMAIGWPLGYLLEAARNKLVPRDLPDDLAQRTAGSGRFYQPHDGVSAWLNRFGTAPFRFLQRMTAETDLGTSYVAFAQSRSVAESH